MGIELDPASFLLQLPKHNKIKDIAKSLTSFLQYLFNALCPQKGHI